MRWYLVAGACILVLWRAALRIRAGPQPLHPHVIESTSPLIYPDIGLVQSYRTSQLVYVRERPVPGRYVAYQYTGTATPRLVVVLGLNGELAHQTLEMMLADKIAYCEHHGYGLYARYLQDTAPNGVPASDVLGVAKLGLLRQAFEVFPRCTWAMSMDANSVIVNAEFEAHKLVEREYLHQHAHRSVPICKAQDHIRTFRHSRVRDASIVIQVQDDGVDTRWFYLKNTLFTLFTRALLEFGQDPLNQQYAEFHKDLSSPSRMFTHMIVWHPRFLAQVAVIDLESDWRKFTFFGDVREGRRMAQRQFS